MSVPPLPRSEKDHFLKAYTRGLNTTDLGRLFTRDTPDAYRFFSRSIDFDELQKLPWHKRVRAVGAHALPGVHAAPHAGPPADLRHLARGDAHRPDGAVSRDALPARAASGVRARHDVAAHRLPAAQPAGAAGSRRPAVAQERPRDRAADPAGDAAARRLPRRRARSLRHDAAGQHRRRGLLRHPAAARRARAAGARRRCRQRQPGGAADGAAARDDADARGRGARGRQPGGAAERADRQARARIALHHALPRHARPGDRRDALRQRRPEPAAAAPRRRQLRTAARGRHGAGHVPGGRLQGRVHDDERGRRHRHVQRRHHRGGRRPGPAVRRGRRGADHRRRRAGDRRASWAGRCSPRCRCTPRNGACSTTSPCSSRDACRHCPRW